MPAKVTLKSTKQEILDALHAAEKQLSEQKKILSTPAAAAETSQAAEVVANAAVDVGSGIFSDEMTEKYENLVEAIQIQEEKLKNLYSVETALLDMSVVVNASKQARMDLEAELERAKREAKAASDALTAENAQRKADLAIARRREEEEYKYNLSRQRKQEADDHEDKRILLEKKIEEAEAQLAKLQEDAEAIDALQARVDGLPSELDAKYKEGFSDGQKAAGKEYGYKTAMSEKEHSYELRERDSKIERLEKDSAEKSQKIAALEAKLDAAYTQLRDLATKTVESSGGLKVISTASDGSTSRK